VILFEFKFWLFEEDGEMLVGVFGEICVLLAKVGRGRVLTACFDW